VVTMVMEQWVADPMHRRQLCKDTVCLGLRHEIRMPTIAAILLDPHALVDDCGHDRIVTVIGRSF
jgi:hypothetical protein